MSYSEEEDLEKVEVIPMPRNRVRFTDMPQAFAEKAIRCKIYQLFKPYDFSVRCC
jgi:hypothetical protein